MIPTNYNSKNESVRRNGRRSPCRIFWNLADIPLSPSSRVLCEMAIFTFPPTVLNDPCKTTEILINAIFGI